MAKRSSTAVSTPSSSCDAGGGSGAAFAIAYAAFLAVMTWLWYEVGRQDVVERPEFISDTGRYVVAMAVLVVFGVVDGLSRSQCDVKTIATGMIALVVGFGFWWIYFDVVGGRLPKSDGRALANWILSHHPITLSIAAAGFGMVSLLEHAHDANTPAPTSWLLSGAVAGGMVALILTSRALADARQLAAVYRPLGFAMAVGAGVGLIIGWARPAPWLLALLLVVVLSPAWAVAVRGFLLAGAWAPERSVN